MAAILLALALIGNPPDDPPSPKFEFRPEMFPTLVNPACSHCIDECERKAGEFRPDDRVLAWIRGKYDGGAIPYRWFLVPYRVISDTYGVFVHDADAGFARGWPASLDYRFHGWRNGVMVMRHKDGTLFDCLTGVAFEGPRKGERLEPLPTIETDWGPWLKSSPGTVAYAMVAKFEPRPMPEATDRRVARDPARPRPAARRRGARLRPRPGRIRRRLAAEIVRRGPRGARGQGRRAARGDPLGRADADRRRLCPRGRGRVGRPRGAGRRPGRPRCPVGRPADRVALVDRRPRRQRPAQGADAPLAAGRDGQVVRLGGRVSRHGPGGGRRDRGATAMRRIGPNARRNDPRRLAPLSRRPARDRVSRAQAQGTPVDLSGYRDAAGVSVRHDGDTIALAWPIEGGESGRLVLDLRPGVPLIASMGLADGEGRRGRHPQGG